MKRILFISIMLIVLSFGTISNAIVASSSQYSISSVKAYVFYNEENEVYNEEKTWLDENINIRKEYINTNDNNELFTKVKEALKIKKDKFPITIIGSTYFIGFDEKIKNNIEEAFNAYSEAEEYGDIVEKIKNNEDVTDLIKQNEKIYKQKSNVNIILIIVITFIVVVLIIFIIKAILKNKKRTNRFKKSI